MRRIFLVVVFFVLVAVGAGKLMIVHGQNGPAILTARSYATYTTTNSLLRPTAVYISPANTRYLFIADSGHNQIDYFSDGSLTVIAGNGQAGMVDGAVGSAEFNGPTSIGGPGFYTRSGGYGSIPTTGLDLIIVDGLNNAVRQICQYRLGYMSPNPACGPTQGVTTLSGGTQGGYQDGTGANAQFSFPGPLGSSYTLAGQLVPDVGNNALRSLDTTGTVVQTAIAPALPGYQDGPLASARFRGIASITSVSGSNPHSLLTDIGNFVVRSIDQNNNVSTFAGSGVQGYADGPPSTAQFAMPLSITFNSADGYTYLADALNNCIRRIDSNGNVSTYAGQAGNPGLQDGPGSQAQFSHPSSITIAAGFMYVADTNNNAIRRIDMSDGQVSTLLH